MEIKPTTKLIILEIVIDTKVDKEINFHTKKCDKCLRNKGNNNVEN